MFGKAKVYFVSSWIYDLRQPIINTLESIKSQCIHCGVSFENLSEHYKSCHPDTSKIPKKEVVDYSDISKIEIEDYLEKCEVEKRSHHRKDRINRILNMPCDYCDHILRTTKLVKLHYKTWHSNREIITPGRTKYFCNQCQDFFFIQDELDCHLNLIHGVEMSDRGGSILWLLKRCPQNLLPYTVSED